MSGSFFGKLGFDPGNTIRPDMGILEDPFYNGSDLILLLKCSFRPPQKRSQKFPLEPFLCEIMVAIFGTPLADSVLFLYFPDSHDIA